MELFKGRPENVEGRLPREIRTYDFLDELGIEYMRTDHEPADNMEACNKIDAVLEVTTWKSFTWSAKTSERWISIIRQIYKKRFLDSWVMGRNRFVYLLVISL